jgi:tetratricopeptide (TPR) repeat protein
VSEPNKAQVIKIVHRGTEYRWTPQAGFTTPSGMSAPTALRPLLEALLEPVLAAEDDSITDKAVLTERAGQARRQKQYARAEKLARRALQIDSKYAAAGAVFAGVMRDRNRPEAALSICDKFVRDQCADLEIERAGACCELHRWAEALKAAQSAQALLEREGRDSKDLAKLVEMIEAKRVD